MRHERRSSMTLRLAAHAALLMSSFVGACGPAARIGPEPNEPGTALDEAGAAQHRAAADREAARLAQHKDLYDPHASESFRRCDPARATQYPETPICWVETVNPTAVHLKEVEEHRMRAVQHRKAARDLEAVEARACADVADEDRDISPFSHQGDIVGVNPLEVAAGGTRKGRQLVGATIVFRAVPGLTAGELQSIVDCHLARNAAIGHEIASAEMEHCLLTERGVHAKVRELRNGFAVDVRADAPETAQAVWRRAQELARLQ
jgi:hypothetical protein